MRFGILPDTSPELPHSPTAQYLNRITQSPTKNEIKIFIQHVRTSSNSTFVALNNTAIKQDVWKTSQEKALSMAEYFSNISINNEQSPLNSQIQSEKLLFESKALERKKETQEKLQQLEDKNTQLERNTENCIQNVKLLKKKQAEQALRLDENKKIESENKAREAQKEKDAQDLKDLKAAQENNLPKPKVTIEKQPLKTPEKQLPITKNITEPESSKTEPANSVSLKAWESACPLLERIKFIKNEIKPKLLSDKNTQKIIFNARMKITTKLGQFTYTEVKVIEIAKTISDLLVENQPNPMIYELLLDMVAKQVVKQAAKEVAVKQSMAFPIATFCIMLLNKHNQFKGILLGRMIKKCPYIVPMYIKKGTSSDEEYRKNLGYVKKEDGSYETEIQYGERMCGIVSLYSGMVQLTAVKNPEFGIDDGWSWLARILNIHPRRITPLLILTFLEIAGSELYTNFPNQMPKLMNVLMKEVLPRMPQAAIASSTRLRLFLEETVSKTNTIPPHEGRKLSKR